MSRQVQRQYFRSAVFSVPCVWSSVVIKNSTYVWNRIIVEWWFFQVVIITKLCIHAYVNTFLRMRACVRARLFHCVWLFLIPWTVAHQAPLSVGFSRQEHWSGLPCPPPGIFATQEWKPSLLHLLHWQACCLPLEPHGEPLYEYTHTHTYIYIYTHTRACNNHTILSHCRVPYRMITFLNDLQAVKRISILFIILFIPRTHISQLPTMCQGLLYWEHITQQQQQMTLSCCIRCWETPGKSKKRSVAL